MGQRARQTAMACGLTLVAAGCSGWGTAGGQVAAPPDALRCETGSRAFGCFVWVPGGRGLLGAQADDPSAANHDPDAVPEEGPVREVEVPGQWWMRSEVSREMVFRCQEAGACTPGEAHIGGIDEVYVPKVARVAATHMTLKGAQEVCAHHHAALPSEDAWEWAARGPSARRYPWGEAPRCTLPDASVYEPRADQKRISNCVQEGPVSSERMVHATPEGIWALGGNVWEWTDTPFTARRGQEVNRDAASLWVQKGGGWMQTDPKGQRAAGRVGMPPSVKLPDVGVRCVWRGTP